MAPLSPPPVWLIAFTGHRPKANTPGRSPAELEATRPLIKEALLVFQNQAAQIGGTIQLLSSAAEGADLIGFEVAQSFNPPIPVHLILPLPESEFQNDYIESQSGRLSQEWNRAKSLIDSCRTGSNGNTLRLASSTHERPGDAPVGGPDCYADTNFQMLACADALIAVKTDAPSSTAGGSASFWKAAEARKLPRLWINPQSGTSSPALDMDQLTAINNESNGLRLLQNLQHHLHGAGDFTRSAKIKDPTGLVDENHSLSEAQALFDNAANSYSKQTRNNLRYTISLHGSASFLAAIGLAYALAGGPASKEVLFTLVLIEVILIALAEHLHRQAHRKHLGKAWLDCRFAAETLRMLEATCHLTDPLQSVIDSHRPAWRRFVLSFNLQRKDRPSTPPSLETLKSEYLKNRIQDQITYFKSKSSEATPKSRRAYYWMRFSSIAALAVVIVACVFKGVALMSHASHTHASHHDFSLKDFLLYLLPVALPLLAGILLALRHSFDLGRRQHRYQHMIQLLEAAKTNLTEAQTPITFQQVVTQVEETLLDERIEFDIAQRIGLEH